MNDKTRKDIMISAIRLTYVKEEERKHRTKDQIFDILYDLFPETDETNIKIIANGAIEMHNSLMETVDQAGGGGWSFAELLDMTYLNLLNSLATNGIRFYFERLK